MIRGSFGRSVIYTSSFLHSSSYYNGPLYLCFSFVVDDTHIVGPTLNVLLDFLRLQDEFGALGLLVQPKKCVTWSPLGLNQFIAFPPCFFTPKYSFCIIGALVGSLPFLESFVSEVLWTLARLLTFLCS